MDFSYTPQRFCVFKSEYNGWPQYQIDRKPMDNPHCKNIHSEEIAHPSFRQPEANLYQDKTKSR
jgi:hypothetical protein